MDPLSINDAAPSGVAIIGCGIVGGATAALLLGQAEFLASRSGAPVALRRVVDLDLAKARAAGVPDQLLSKDLGDALSDPGVSIVVELVGGTGFAKAVIERALDAGKHVVTANKALLAHHGAELLARARAKGVTLSFEASCGGGIPIIRALYDGLIANRIDAIFGIVNGTCNYILTQMIERGQSYADALAGAQRLGFAEADPTLDVSGGDSAHKLAIMASLAFGARVDLASIPVAGIDSLDFLDVSYGLKLGYVVKLLAIAERMKEGISLRVQPSFIPKDHPLAWVSGPFNAISVYGSENGHTMYYGRGAGGGPTASAVVSDILAAASGEAALRFEKLGVWSDRCPAAAQLPAAEVRSRYYMRAMVDDRPGVLAKLASIMAEKGISISSVLQPEAEGASVPVVITTHVAREGDMSAAAAEIARLPFVRERPVVVGIVEEHPEFRG